MTRGELNGKAERAFRTRPARAERAFRTRPARAEWAFRTRPARAELDSEGETKGKLDSSIRSGYCWTLCS
ncbi:hypothetical protein VZT92_009566 [Zoarces viviparus]|uniref:Uncharacterized protein n=1 Tax=Zoarces viviparus TaxID=48416 RepID=A0AAW1FCR8_ZOAVI